MRGDGPGGGGHEEHSCPPFPCVDVGAEYSDYEAYGGVLRAPLALPSLPRVASGPDPHWTIQRVDAEDPEPPLDKALGAVEVEQGVTLRAFRRTAGFALRFEDTGTFEIPGDGALIRWIPGPDPDSAKLVQDIVGRVVPVALHLDGAFALHGSAVAIDGEGIAFVAPKGYGKSTLARALLDRGALLCTDDVVVVRGGARAMLHPGVQALRLDGDSRDRFGEPGAPDTDAAVKRVVHPGPDRIQRDPVPLAAVYLLAPASGAGPEPVRRRASGPAATIALLRESKLGPLLGGTESEAMLGSAAHVAERVPVWQLEYSRSWTSLDVLAGRIVAWHGAAAAGGR
jgi:hypothetical protein